MSGDLDFTSRRSALLCCKAAVSCDQPLASQAGIEMIKDGGNAADAAVAMAAVLSVTQPNTTGLGGDAFCLFYDSKTKQVHGINGSGRSASATTLAKVTEDGFGPDRPLPQTHGHAVTVPGAAATWLDTIEKYGSGNVSRARILQPAIDVAVQGFPVTEICAYYWKQGEHLLQEPRNIHGHTLLVDGKAPRHGQVFRNPSLAGTITNLALKGKSGFYEGSIADAIAASVQHHGGLMTSQDIANHANTYDEQISTDYKGVSLWEIPPNGQGIVALMALNLLENFDLQSMGHNSTEYLHTLCEVFRLCFADGVKYIADRAVVKVPCEEMLSKTRAKQRAKLITECAMVTVEADDLHTGGDTTYFTAVDQQGNACSFINSNFDGFGTGIVPEGCGFTLQNRGSGFALSPDHANVMAPNKRPYHTIIPAMLTDTASGDLLSSYGVMGGYMQPQGHVQVLLNMLEFGMDPQRALDQPRICIGSGYSVTHGLCVEDGIPHHVIEGLRRKGHDVTVNVGHRRAVFGRGHVITKGAWWQKEAGDRTRDVWWTGTDPRCDGLALGF